jgi:carbonic anhydrase/acetyltransferase-like protein (isoleucine patch superfamily)
MPTFEHRGVSPRIDPTAYVAPTAVVSGSDVVVMEHALIRGRASHPCAIGDAVMIGPHAHVNGALVGSGAFLATGSSVFPGARIGDGAEVRINGVVQVNTTLAPGAVVPIGWVAVGESILPPSDHDGIWQIQRGLDFPGTVYGATRDDNMADIMRGQSEFYGAHAEDRDIGG